MSAGILLLLVRPAAACHAFGGGVETLLVPDQPPGLGPRHTAARVHNLRNICAVTDRLSARFRENPVLLIGRKRIEILVRVNSHIASNRLRRRHMHTKTARMAFKTSVRSEPFPSQNHTPRTRRRRDHPHIATNAPCP